MLASIPSAVIHLSAHRDLLAHHHAARFRPRRPGRPRTVRSIRLLVLRLSRENPCYVKLVIMWNSLTVSQ